MEMYIEALLTIRILKGTKICSINKFLIIALLINITINFDYDIFRICNISKSYLSKKCMRTKLGILQIII